MEHAEFALVFESVSERRILMDIAPHLVTAQGFLFPVFSGLEEASKFENTDFKIFGKPSARPFRRMGVALAYGSENVVDLVNRAKKVAVSISID